MQASWPATGAVGGFGSTCGIGIGLVIGQADFAKALDSKSPAYRRSRKATWTLSLSIFINRILQNVIVRIDGKYQYAVLAQKHDASGGTWVRCVLPVGCGCFFSLGLSDLALPGLPEPKNR